jgi:hypothetical protein
MSIASEVGEEKRVYKYQRSVVEPASSCYTFHTKDALWASEYSAMHHAVLPEGALSCV